MKARWLMHPESPGERVLVVRGWFGWLFKPRWFATPREVLIYRAMQEAI